MAEQSFSYGCNTIEYGLVPWDTEIFGYGVVEITGITVGDSASLPGAIRAFDEHIRKSANKVIYAKVPIVDRDVFEALQHAGYLFVEETIKPYISDLQTSGRDYARHIKYPLVKAQAADITRIQDIASSTFTNTRFHQDKNFGLEKANYRYEYWVNNSFASGEDVLYLSVDGNTAGFSIIRFGLDSAFLSLIGLSNDYKGLGLGENLYSATCQYVRDKGFNLFVSNISLNNLPALNLHCKCGFKFKEPLYVLHKWL